MESDVWFTTNRGKTVHNQPGTPNFVEGEPEFKPDVALQKCLKDGFARTGYPNTGDLQRGFYGRLAPAGYSLNTVDAVSNSPFTVGQLQKFAHIRAGDYIVTPAETCQYWVYIGLVLSVVRTRIKPGDLHRPPAYYFYVDIPNGEFYEYAHRVNVSWAKDPQGEFVVVDVPQIGGVWRQSFAQLKQAAETIRNLAEAYHLLGA